MLASVQTPAWQVFTSHLFPSLHVVPSATGGLEHRPVLGLHVPGEWHGSDAPHSTVIPAVQTPLRQTSFESQRLPSLHVVPSGGGGTAAHEPAPSHASVAPHELVFEPHAVPSVAGE